MLAYKMKMEICDIKNAFLISIDLLLLGRGLGANAFGLVFTKVSCCARTASHQKFVHYIRMTYTGWFIFNGIVYKRREQDKHTVHCFRSCPDSL